MDHQLKSSPHVSVSVSIREQEIEVAYFNCCNQTAG